MKYKIYKQFIPVSDSDPEWAQRNVYVGKLNENDTIDEFSTKQNATDNINAKIQKNKNKQDKDYNKDNENRKYIIIKQ